MRAPKGMFRRKRRDGKPGAVWWTRDQRGARDRWVSLGEDLELAIIKFHKMRSGEVAPSRVTLTQAVKLWAESRGQQRRSAKYLGEGVSRLRRYVEPVLGSRTLASVAPSDVERLAVRLRQDHPKLKPETRRHILSDLRCVLRWAVDEGLLARSPIPHGLVGKVQAGPSKAFSDEERELLLAAQGSHGFLLRVALGTGLAWADLLPRQADELKSVAGTWCFQVRRRKTGQPAVIPVHPELAAEIRGHCGRLFPFRSASTSSFNRAVRRRTGLESFTVHRARHTFAAGYRAAGGRGDVLDSIMGHASRSPMRDRYAPLTPEAVVEDARRVWDAMARTSSSTAVARGHADGS